MAQALMVDIYRPSPLMPAGFGMAPLAGEPLAGGGINFPIWPNMLETFVTLPPLIVTPAMLAEFTDGPADLTIADAAWQITMPRETRTQTIRGS